MMVFRAVLTLLLLVLCISCALAQNEDADYEDQEDEWYPLEEITPEIHYVNASDDADPFRVVGGQAIPISRAKWQAALIKDGHFHCGGVIINRLWVLTAAHCIETGGSYVVRVGSRYFKRGGQTRRVQLIVMHASFNKRTRLNDIALLRLNRPLKFNTNVGYAKLASPNTALKQRMMVSGWGGKRKGSKVVRVLGAAYVQSVPRSTCIKKYLGQNVIPPGTICAGAPGKGACKGDSGGPLVNRGVLFGIVSFGKSCANKRFPDVYTDVRYQRDWILKALRKFRYY